ncbi:MAG: PEP-CTERM sorting domain-containing protein [Pseudomonadota bacterium]
MTIRPALVATLLAAALPAHATTTAYFDEAAFQAAAGALSFDSFEDLAPSVSTASESLARVGYQLSSTAFGGGFGLYSYTGPSGFGAFATDGNGYLVHQTDVAESLVFEFDTAIHAFGFTLTDWDNPLVTGDARLMLGNDAGDKVLVTTTPMMDGDTLFFGIVNTAFAFTEVTLFNTSNNEAYGIDGVYFSAPVPVPGALLLFGSALAGSAFLRRPTPSTS